jgi:hypothetical protein
MNSDSITFQWLKNLHVAMPAKAQAHFLWCAVRKSLQFFYMASFSLYIPTNVRAIIHWTLETPSCALWIQGVSSLIHNPSRSWQFWHIPAFLTTLIDTYKTDLYHLLGQLTPILARGGTWSSWSLQESFLNMIQVTYQTRGQSVTSRKFQTGHPNPNTMLLHKDHTSSLICNSSINQN